MQFFINYSIYASIIGIYSRYHEKVKNSIFSRLDTIDRLLQTLSIFISVLNLLNVYSLMLQAIKNIYIDVSH